MAGHVKRKAAAAVITVLVFFSFSLFAVEMDINIYSSKAGGTGESG